MPETLLPKTFHKEEHFTAGPSVRDVVIGMADGLTVPFALAAGLSGAIAGSQIVVTAGLAEIAAGSIAMGLGGYLSAKSECEHYINERRREEREIIHKTEVEKLEVAEVFEGYGLTPEQIHPIVEAMAQRPKMWVDFMMRFELGLEEPDPKRALQSAGTIAGAYIVGGLIPLAPYMFMDQTRLALDYSVAVTLVALVVFGYIKGRFTGSRPWRSALQTVLIGGLAAAAAFWIAQALS